MPTPTQYHPLQSYKHLCNRLDSNTAHRQNCMQEIHRLEQEIASLQKSISEERDIIDSINKSRSIIIGEGQELLSQLKGFPKTHLALQTIIANET